MFLYRLNYNINRLLYYSSQYYCSTKTSHLVTHNNPPRAQAPEIFDLKQQINDNALVNYEKLKLMKNRLKEFPPPKISIINDDYTENSIIKRAIDRVETWVLGSYHIFTNFEIVYDIFKNVKQGDRTHEEGNIIRKVFMDSLKASNFVAACAFFPPYALLTLLFSLYNPYGKPSTLIHPRDIRKYLCRVCPSIGSFNDMLPEFIGIDDKLLELYGKEFKVDMKTHCLSADDCIRLFPHSRLAHAEVMNMNHAFLVRISHGFPTFNVKLPWRSFGFFHQVGEDIGKITLQDKLRARMPGAIELTTRELWELCYERGLFWTKDGVELSNGQLVYLYAQWMKLVLIKQKNRKTLELLLFFIIFNLGRDIQIPDAKPSDWEFVEVFFKDYSISAQLGAMGRL